MNRYLSKRGKTFYLIKRVPDDVRELHPSGVIRESLKTKDLAVARKIRDRRIKELDASWDAYRLRPKGKHLTSSLLTEALELRKLVMQSENQHEVLEVVEDRTNDLYNAEVPEELHGWERSGAAGEFFAISSGRKMPVRIAVEEFLGKANLKPSTKSLYKGLLQQLGSKFAFLEDMNRKSVRSFLQSYSDGRTKKAIYNLITASRSLLHFHGLDRTVFDGHRVDPGKALVPKGVWSDKEVLRLANANDAPQWLRDCITVAAYSGLRRQEICGLVYDAERDHLVVEADKAKTSNSVRRVACHSKARDAAKRLASPPRVGLNQLTRGMRELADKLDISRPVIIDGVTHKRDFHAFRHTFASKLASVGTEQSVIARILGHAPASVTGRYAGKVDPEVDRPVIERVSYEG